jgi:hypothetical protein
MKELTAARSTCLIPKTILLNVKRNWKWVIQTDSSRKKETKDSHWMVKETV